MQFPFPSIRPSQSEMIDDVKKAVAEGMHMVADAPTGLGKTIAALLPAVEYAVANEKCVFFLTSRLSQHKMAVETLKLLRDSGSDSGISFSAVDIVGKRHLCPQDIEGMQSSMFNNFCSAMIRDKKCAYYKNFYRKDWYKDRMRLLKRLCSGPLSVQESMDLVSKRYCAYEMLMESARRADVIVGDYFHIFVMGEKFLKRMEKELSNSIIIVDEAHNLASRLRSHMSSRVSTRTCELALRECEEFGEHDIEDYIKCIGRTIQDLARKYLFESYETFIIRDEFVNAISEKEDYEIIVDEMTDAAKKVLEEKKRSFIDSIAEFLVFWKGDDYGHARIMSRTRIRGKDHIVLQYKCLDPSLLSKSIIDASHSTILMSGTLSPMEMHRDLLGMDEKRTLLRSYLSPFPRRNRKNIIVRGVTTKYSERTPSNFAKMATMVRLCANSIKGNAAVFFPSYDIRNVIHDIIRPVMYKHIILEDSKMSKEERDRIKDEMKRYADDGAVLLGVMGGSFSEGIDLPGELLNGVIIVGLPLERPDLSSKALIDYYDKRFNRGMEYGYMYPAMIKVIQSAGRCIRSENDRGVIVFADERFIWRNYNSMFPRTWNFVTTTRPEVEVRKFFGCIE